MAHQHDLLVSREGEEFLGKIVGSLLGEGEGEGEGESETEGEEFLGSIGKIVGSLLGEGEEELEYEAEDELEGQFEAEYEDELEALFEDETEDESEEFLGGIGKIVGGLLGGGAGEYEAEFEDEGEEFFKRIGRLVRRAAPILRTIAKTAGPLVATAVGGPLAGMAARAVASQLEGEYEDEGESELEADHRTVMSHPLTAARCEAEALAAMASQAANEAEAEALAGAAAVTALSARDRRALARVLPGLVRGSAVITRLLYGTREARQFVRAVPTIVQDSAQTLVRHAHDGSPVSSVDAGRVMARHAARVLGSRRRCGHALARNVAGATRYGDVAGATRYTGGTGRYGRVTGRRQVPGYDGVRTVRATPVRSGMVGGGAARPTRGASGRPAGTMRVVTPVRVPGRNGQPGRTVRVVTDVRVPRGAVPARTATVSRVASRTR